MTESKQPSQSCFSLLTLSTRLSKDDVDMLLVKEICL